MIYVPGIIRTRPKLVTRPSIIFIVVRIECTTRSCLNTRHSVQQHCLYHRGAYAALLLNMLLIRCEGCVDYVYAYVCDQNVGGVFRLLTKKWATLYNVLALTNDSVETRTRFAFFVYRLRNRDESRVF